MTELCSAAIELFTFFLAFSWIEPVTSFLDVMLYPSVIPVVRVTYHTFYFRVSSFSRFTSPPRTL